MEQPTQNPQKHFLALERAIVFFDLETTGTSTLNDRIVELCAIRLNPDGTQDEVHHLINPTIPIPEGATTVHGISNEMVADKPTFQDLSATLADFFRDCDLAGYNIKSFDVPLLMQEFHRCKKHPVNINEVKLVDAMGIYHNKEKRDLSAALRFYCGREHDEAHSARADVLATMDILKQQLLKYDDLEPNTSFLHNYLSAGASVDGSRRFKRNEKGDIVFNFGKHYGKPAATEPDYLKWMYEKGDFAVDTMMVAKKIYMQVSWEADILQWINGQKIFQKMALASALYTTVKFEKDVFPFSFQRQNNQMQVVYVTEPTAVFSFSHQDAVKIMLQMLEQFFREKGEAV